MPLGSLNGIGDKHFMKFLSYNKMQLKEYSLIPHILGVKTQEEILGFSTTQIHYICF